MRDAPLKISSPARAALLRIASLTLGAAESNEPAEIEIERQKTPVEARKSAREALPPTGKNFPFRVDFSCIALHFHYSAFCEHAPSARL
jgi:hypothetical protein